MSHQFSGCSTLEIEKSSHSNISPSKNPLGTIELHLFRRTLYIFVESGVEAGNGDWVDRGVRGGEGRGGSKAGKNGEKGRERGTPCPTSNKLVIIFSQYLSWIGCYFIIFYCLLLLLLPVRKPPSVSARPSVSSATHSPVLPALPPPFSSPFDRRRRPALFYYLEPLSAPREFTRGTHY